ncbi:hypothetical protein Tco_0643836 [Tanacetum coccineum]
MPKVESVKYNEVLIEEWDSDNEDVFKSKDLQTIDKPSFKKVEFTNARNEPVKSDKQAEKPRMVTQNPKVDKRDRNGKITQKLGYLVDKIVGPRNGKTVYMFVDKFYPIRATLLERMLRHRLPVPPSYCRELLVLGLREYHSGRVQAGLRQDMSVLHCPMLASPEQTVQLLFFDVATSFDSAVRDVHAVLDVASKSSSLFAGLLLFLLLLIYRASRRSI